MRGFGQIAKLCARSRGRTSASSPTIGPVHLELVGSVERRRRSAKAELLDGAAEPAASAVVPNDARLEPYWPRSSIVRRFGPASVLAFDRGARRRRALTRRRGRAPPSRSSSPFTRATTRRTSRAALLAYDALGLPLDSAQRARARIAARAGAARRRRSPGGGARSSTTPRTRTRVSMRAALDAPRRRGRARRSASPSSATMAELGPDAPRYHARDRRASPRAAASPRCSPSARSPRALHRGRDGFVETAGAGRARPRAARRRAPPAGRRVLVKASRSVGLERLPQRELRRRWTASSSPPSSRWSRRSSPGRKFIDFLRRASSASTSARRARRDTS